MPSPASKRDIELLPLLKLRNRGLEEIVWGMAASVPRDSGVGGFDSLSPPSPAI